MRWRLSRLPFCLSRRLVAVEHRPHRAVADRMHRDLQAAAVGLDRHLGELLRRKQRLAAPARPVGIVVDHHRRPGIEHAVVEHFHHARRQPFGIVFRGHHRRLLERIERHEILVVERYLRPAKQPALGFDLRQQFELMQVAVHVLDRGDAVPGAPFEPALHDGAVMRLLLRRRPGIGFAAGRESQPGAALAGKLEQRSERLALAQFAVRQPVGAHHDLVARPERLAVQQPGSFERFRVRPHRMMIRRRHREGPVGDDAVEMMARHRLGSRQDRVVGALRLQQFRLGPLRGICANRLGQRFEAGNAGQLQMVEFGGAGEQMHMRFDEARHDRIAAGIDHPCCRARASRRRPRDRRRRRSSRRGSQPPRRAAGARPW